MTSLRMRVVEAGARKLRGRDELRDAGRLPSSERETELAVRAVLDAMLDCLTENADEWVEGAGRLVLTTDSIYEALIVILREPTDG